jgi:hypothetical protein
MPARRGGERIPKQLRVQMGVKIYEARGYGEAVRMDHSTSATAQPPQLNDLSVSDPDISPVRRKAASIIDAAPFDQEIVCHACPLSRN